MIRDTAKDLAVLPRRDKHGRRVIVFKMWDANKWSFKQGLEAFYVIALFLAREPKTQISGVTMIGDYSGMSRKHMTTNLEDMKAWANLISVWYFLSIFFRSQNIDYRFYSLIRWDLHSKFRKERRPARSTIP